MTGKVNTALIQFEIGDDWARNMNCVESLLEKAASKGAQMAILPELFNMPYDLSLVTARAESIPDGPTCGLLSRWASRFGLCLVGGSIAEKDVDGRYYNTATVWDNNGHLVARHRKMHLFDVDLPGGVSVKESAVFSPGSEITVVDILGIRLGVAICYDLRFPELFRLMTIKGADLVALPGAFNHVSGPAHWEMHLRGRAVENTIYVAGVSGTSSPGSVYNAWGHSMLVDPFGEIKIHLGRAEGLGLADVDPERIKQVRAGLPVLVQRRTDVYRLDTAD
jgi:omega-amidase